MRCRRTNQLPFPPSAIFLICGTQCSGVPWGLARSSFIFHSDGRHHRRLRFSPVMDDPPRTTSRGCGGPGSFLCELKMKSPATPVGSFFRFLPSHPLQIKLIKKTGARAPVSWETRTTFYFPRVSEAHLVQQHNVTSSSASVRSSQHYSHHPENYISLPTYSVAIVLRGIFLSTKKG